MMETYKNLKKGTKIGLIISMVLVFAEMCFIVFNLYHYLQTEFSEGIFTIIEISLMLLICFFTMLYALVGYKKPHGNMLRILFFAFGTIIAWIELMPFPAENQKLILLGQFCVVTASLLIVYISGRLNKIKKNKILLSVAGVLFAVDVVIKANVIQIFFFSGIIGALTPLVILTALGFAYTARFEEHKAAGLEDK